MRRLRISMPWILVFPCANCAETAARPSTGCASGGNSSISSAHNVIKLCSSPATSNSIQLEWICSISRTASSLSLSMRQISISRCRHRRGREICESRFPTAFPSYLHTKRLIAWAPAHSRCRYRVGGECRQDCSRCCLNCPTMPDVRFRRRTTARSSRRSQCRSAHHGSSTSRR